MGYSMRQMPKLFTKLIWLWTHLGKFQLQAIIFILITFAAALFDGLGLSLIIPIIDTVLNGKTDSVFGTWIIQIFGNIGIQALLIGCASLLTLSMVLKEAFVLWRAYFTTRFGLGLRNHWRMQLSESILCAQEGALSENRRGALLDLMVNQTHSACKFVQFTLQMLIDAIFAAVMLTIMMMVSWWITLIIIAVFGFVIGVTHIPTRAYSNRLGRKAVSISLKVSSLVSESLMGLREVKVLSLEQETLRKIDSLGNQQLFLTVREKILTQLPSTAGNLLVAFLVLFGILYFAISPTVNIQELLPTAALFILVGQRLSKYITAVISKWIVMRTQFPALLLVTDTLNELTPINKKSKSINFERLKGDIIFQDVSFEYDNKNQVFQSINLTLPKGAITTIIGTSGSGKSTISDLLLALRQPQQGYITINEKALHSYEVRSWRRRCAYVAQHPFLFNTSVLENIRLGRMDASDEEIKDAANRAYADEFIMSLSHGYNTTVGEGGSSLSGGQAQRITIARALLRDPDLIVFDEPTSAIDNSSRDYLRKTFRNLAQENKTVLVMSHDPIVIADADFTWEIRGNTIVPLQKI